jgi:hypothetical protein
MEGPNGRWKTEDGELTRIRRRARGESSLGCGSGCSAEDLFVPAGESAAGAGNALLRLAECLLGARNRSRGQRAAPSAARWAARRREPSARRSVRPLRPRAGAFAARIVCSASRTPASAVCAPARRPGSSRRSRRRRQRNSSAGFRNRNVGSGARRVRSALDPLAPEPDSSSREPIRRVRHPTCRLRRRIGWLRRSMRHRGGASAFCSPSRARSGSSRPAILARCRSFARPGPPSRRSTAP